MPFPAAETAEPPGPVTGGQDAPGPPPTAPVSVPVSVAPAGGTPFLDRPNGPGAEVGADSGDFPPGGLGILSSRPAEETLAEPAAARTAGETTGGSRTPRRSLRIAIVAVIVLALAGGGTAAALVLSGGHGRANAAPPPRHTPSHTPTPTSTPTPSSPSPTPSPPTVATSPPSGPVTAAPGVASDLRTAPILTLLDSYFSAINGHHYHAYLALLSPAEAQGLTVTQFDSGYASSKDSKETLESISTPPDGSTVAHVSFTSHQNPAASVNGSESCTDWRISLYLEQGPGGYIIGKPPPSYHAKYAAC